MKTPVFHLLITVFFALNALPALADLSNNDCGGAILLTPASTCNPVSGTTIGATTSVIYSECLNNAPENDVWYKFVATAANHSIVTEFSNQSSDGCIQLRAGDCNGTSLGCAFSPGGHAQINATGLTVGSTYYIMVCTLGGAFDFTICVTNCSVNTYNVSGGGDYCPGGSGLSVGLDGSDASVTYQLYRNNSAVGSVVNGTGNAISFGNFTTPGNYTVIGTHVICGNTAAMNGSVQVNQLTLHTYYYDGDGDGYHGSTQSACVNPGVNWSSSTSGPDCNDDDPSATVEQTWYLDNDGDGYSVSSTVSCSSPGSGYTTSISGTDDCNDSNPFVHVPITWFYDADGDFYNSATQESCFSPGANWIDITLGIDCDDNNSSVQIASSWYLDADDDTYFSTSQESCNNPGAGYVSSGEVTGGNDCDDNNAAIHPNAFEECNSIDENCDGDTDTLSFNAAITAEGPTTFCKQGSVLLNGTPAGNNYSFQWFRNGNPIAESISDHHQAKRSGDFHLQVSNASCTASSNHIQVTELELKNPVAKIKIVGENLNLCNGKVKLRANGTEYTYEWMLDGNVLPGITSKTYYPSQEGNYSVSASNAAGCTDVSQTVTVTNTCKNLAPADIPLSFTVYPNPSTGWVVVELDGLPVEGELTIYIVNSIGQRILEQPVFIASGKLKQQLQLPSTAPADMYQIMITNGEKMWGQKLIVQR